jgi:probable HAF family extracellular repeat protein
MPRIPAAITILISALVLLGLGGTARGQTPSYMIQKIGLAGSSLNYAEGINDSGGALSTIFLRAAVFQNGQTSGAGILVGYTGSYDYAINDRGRSVGWAIKLLGIYPGPTLTHAVLFAHGTAQDLGALPGSGNASTAYAINNLDVAAGFSQVGSVNGASHATLFSFFAGRTVTDLGTLPGDGSSVAYGINDLGVVVGSSIGADDIERAVQFTPGPVKLLGTLPGGAYSEARGINNQGQAVGFSSALRGPDHAVMFAGGQVFDLGIYPGGTRSIAVAINNFGQAVGSGDVADGTAHALLFQNGQVVDLGRLPGGQGSSAHGINDRGDIVGVVDDPTAVWAVKWTLAHQAAGPVKPGPR